jgi:glutathione S-transferase
MMILIGQYDSPFVRRVGVALRLYDILFRHEPWSSFGESDKIRAYNPLTRVPTLVLDDGMALTDSHLILGYLDSLVGPGRRLWPAAGRDRAEAYRVAGIATGAADKAVSLFYEIRLHATTSDLWRERCARQIVDALAALEASRAARPTPYWFGNAITHADIAAACAIRFITEVHGERVNLGALPALRAFSDRMEALPVMLEISQPFIPPA